MIVFDLKCDLGHVFEAWFKSSDAYETQRALGEIECPHCLSNRVEKAVMAPNVKAKANSRVDDRMVAADVLLDGEDREQVGYTRLPAKLQDELETVLAKVRKHVEETCEYVGPDFPEEARKIHYGEVPERGIYGEATREESMELLEEGIDVIPVPGIRKPGPTDA